MGSQGPLQWANTTLPRVFVSEHSITSVVKGGGGVVGFQHKCRTGKHVRRCLVTNSNIFLTKMGKLHVSTHLLGEQTPSNSYLRVAN